MLDNFIVVTNDLAHTPGLGPLRPSPNPRYHLAL